MKRLSVLLALTTGCMSSVQLSHGRCPSTTAHAVDFATVGALLLAGVLVGTNVAQPFDSRTANGIAGPVILFGSIGGITAVEVVAHSRGCQ